MLENGFGGLFGKRVGILVENSRYHNNFEMVGEELDRNSVGGLVGNNFGESDNFEESDNFGEFDNFGKFDEIGNSFEELFEKRFGRLTGNSWRDHGTQNHWLIQFFVLK